MEQMSASFSKMLAKARICIMQKKESCFLANVVMRLKYVVDNKQSTAWVDGITIGINDDFFALLTNEQRATLLAHEVGHVVREHFTRRGNRDKKLWNYAGDYVINQELKDAGGKETIWHPLIWKNSAGGESCWLQDDRFAGMSTEQVYDILKKENFSLPQKPKGGSGGKGMPSEEEVSDIANSSRSESEQQEINEQVKEIIISSAQAAIMAGQPGSIPGDVKVWLDSLLKPKLPLAQHLRRFFKVLDNSRYSWERPNRRLRPHGFYMPSLRGNKLCHIVFAFDMSGSVSDKDIQRYVSELAGVMKSLKPTKLTVIQFDTRIISVDEVGSINDIRKLDLHGRGGTCISPLMNWAKEHKPEALVVFTDGYFHINSSFDPKIPTLWMIHGNPNCRMPFGQTTIFEV